MAKAPEFSRLIAVEGISPDKARKESIEANADECKALAKRFDLRELCFLKGDITIRRIEGGDVVRLQGKFAAEVVQTCVVSLQDVHEDISGEFETFFAEKNGRREEDDLDFLEDDDNAPEAVINGNIDLGELIAQYLSLELNPYPRAPGVSLAAQLAEVGVGTKSNPFAVLQGLKGKPQAEQPKAEKKAEKPEKPAKADKSPKAKKGQKGKK